MESRKSTREQHHGEPWSHSCGFTASFAWPPRSYPCSFCKREFRSAQALGGHMNVHRRDRARLRQCSPPTPANPNPRTTTTTTTTIPNLNYPPPPPQYCPNNNSNISHGHDGSSRFSSLAVAAARARLEVNLELGVGVCCSTAGVMEDGLDLELRLGCS